MIYVLFLEQGMWYVGWTDRKDGSRFTEHFTGSGAKWTQKYRPIQVMEWREGTLEDEDRITLEYMGKYGWWNVRGGKWCQVAMTAPPTELTPELPAALNTGGDLKPKRVYKKDNALFIKIEPVRPKRQHKREESRPVQPIESSSATPIRQYKKKDPQPVAPQPAENTWESFTSALVETGLSFIENLAASDWSARHEIESVTEKQGCTRCGRPSHTAAACYARTHMNGDRL